MQEHLRHADIQTTTVYTRLTQSDVQKVISELDKNCGGTKTAIRVPSPTAPKLWGENSSNFGVVAPTGFEPVFQPG